MKCEAACPVPKERANPLDQVRADPFSAEEGKKGWRLPVVKATFDNKEESGDLVTKALEGLNIVLPDEGGISGGSPRE